MEESWRRLFPHSSFLSTDVQGSAGMPSKVLQLLMAAQLKVRSLSEFADPSTHARESRSYF